MNLPIVAAILQYAGDMSISLLRAGAGLLIGTMAGILAAVFTSSHRNLDATLGNLLRFFRSIPSLALVPFVMLAFGISEQSRYFLIAWAAFFPVWINTHAGLSTTDSNVLRLGTEVYFTPAAMYLHVKLPSALPFIVTGVRVSIGTSLVLLVAAEFMGANSGLAYRLGIYQQIFRLDLVCVQMATLGVLGLILDRAYVACIRSNWPWIKI